MTISATGDTWTIRSGDHEAEIIQLGGGLRSYRVVGRDVVAGYPAGRKPDAGRGQVLMPWPNRIRDGKFSFAGHEEVLALSEPAKGNASHGLARWATWSLQDAQPDSVRVGYRLLAGQGWDWPLDLAVTYRVGDDGLHVLAEATNVGDQTAPFGYGHHPYLTVGEANLDETTLTVPASTYIEVDERSLPTGTSPVSGDTDLRAGKALKGVQLDTAFTDLVASGDNWEVTLEGHGHRTTMWAHAATFPYVQCFTADVLPGGKARTTGLAVEPMTCPADAFNSGAGVVSLAPGQTWAGRWGIRAS